MSVEDKVTGIQWTYTVVSNSVLRRFMAVDVGRAGSSVTVDRIEEEP